jgi:hypothetical protein
MEVLIAETCGFQVASLDKPDRDRPLTQMRLFFGVKGGASPVIPNAVQRACRGSADTEHPQRSGDAMPSSGAILLVVLVM